MDTDEVRKRKEYAERKVKERHAALKKEAEERRKQTVEHRERVQSVLKREQVLLQKRMQQLNEDEERKKVTLAKQHEATSRIAAITKSPKSFAFGSSTPRTLAYLDNLPKSEQQYDKKLRPLEDMSQATSPASTTSTTKLGRVMTTPHRPPPASHRPAPAMTSMTSSMYVTSSAPPTRHAKTSVKPSAMASATALAKKASQVPTSMMTQSVYTPTSRPASSRLSMGARPNRGLTPNSSKPNQPLASAPIPSQNRRSLDIRKPPMLKRNVLSKPESKKPELVIVDASVQEEKPLKSDETVLGSVDPTPLVEETTSQEEVNVIPEEPVKPTVHDEVQLSEHDENPVMPMQVKEASQEAEELHQTSESTLIAVSDVAGSPVARKLIGFYDNVSESEKAERDTEGAFIEVVTPFANSIPESFEKTEDALKKPETTPFDRQVSKEDLVHQEISESHVGSSTNTSLANELTSIEMKQLISQQENEHSKPQQYDLHDDTKDLVPLPDAVNDLVDVFGNDFINQNQPQRIIEFDEDTDSGKASPTSSETSSTTDEVTPRIGIEEAKIAAPRVFPIVRSAEDMARKEKEAQEAEERKNRLAAILAKSRGMASPMTNTLPPTAADIKDSTNSPVTSPPTPPSPRLVEQSTSSANASTEEIAEKATNESGKANDVLARVALMTNSSTLQKILQRKQGSNPSLQTSESTGGEIY